MSHALKTKAVNDYLEALNTQNMGIIESLFDAEATVEDPYGSNTIQGMEAIKAFYQHAFDANVTGELTGPVRTSGDCAAFAFSINYNGSLIDAIDVFQFNEADKVISMKAYWSENNITPLEA